jgi:hypothetical protein
LAHQRCWLAVLLAARHAGSLQYCWCQALRASARNGSWQFAHVLRLAKSIDATPCGRRCSTGHEQPEQDGPKANKTKRSDRPGANKTTNKTPNKTTFRPLGSDEIQNGDDRAGSRRV